MSTTGMPTVTAAPEKVGLAEARTYLSTVDHSRVRRLRSYDVERYARDMLEGDLKLNGETIVFNNLGRLIEGNHRLHGLVMAATKGVEGIPPQPDLTVWFLVARGVEADPAVEATINTGRTRLYRDHLAIDGVRDSAQVAALTRRLAAWDKGYRYGAASNPPKVATTPGLDRVRYKHEDEIQQAVVYARQHYFAARLAPSTLSLAYILLRRLDSEQAEDFLSRVWSGIGVPALSPMAALRDRLERVEHRVGRRKASPQVNAERLAYMFITWNHARSGTETIASIILPQGELSNKNFPIPR